MLTTTLEVFAAQESSAYISQSNNECYYGEMHTHIMVVRSSVLHGITDRNNRFLYPLCSLPSRFRELHLSHRCLFSKSEISFSFQDDLLFLKDFSSLFFHLMPVLKEHLLLLVKLPSFHSQSVPAFLHFSFSYHGCLQLLDGLQSLPSNINSLRVNLQFLYVNFSSSNIQNHKRTCSPKDDISYILASAWLFCCDSSTA